MSRLQIIILIMTAALAMLLAGCNNMSNENANSNANTTANANRPVVAEKTNANANDNRRTGLTRADYEKNKEKFEKEAKQSGRKIGTGASDVWLWIKTRYDLAAADDLRDSTINVDVQNGAVTLTGTVPTAAQKAKAEQVVKSVEGVSSVKNQIAVAVENKNTNANSNRVPKKTKG